MQRCSKQIIVLFLTLWYSHCAEAQVLSDTGSIKQEIDTIIQYLPAPDGNQYVAPSSTQQITWSDMLDSLFAGNYSNSASIANSVGYNLLEFTDTTTIPNKTYYMLKTMGVNFWGTYLYNPNYCRPVVIQSPHPKKDANTGKQGLHVFKESEAFFFCLAGTHRCNSTIYSTCSGTTTACSPTSANYRDSDMAHNTNSIFQATTENLSTNFGNIYFIQLHGFTKLSTDPYVILSNGTQVASCPDLFPTFTSNLYNEDNTLTFKVGHLDLSWTRLRGFWNTQSRLINGTSNPCNVSATSTNGRFFHMEQEKTKLRDDVTGWNKVANAVTSTFPCTLLTDTTAIVNGSVAKDYHVSCAPFTWIDGNSYNYSNTTASHILTNAAGCDSLVLLKLTINNNAGTDTQFACDSYTWIDGNTYTSSNSTATHTLTNAAGCDSIVTLDLTLNANNSSIDTQMACYNYTWIDGVTYIASNNTATHILTNSSGCDSIVTLNLTINTNSTGTDTQTACKSYTWIDGNTYISSNSTATFVIPNSAGCDSAVTLNLTINNVDTSVTQTGSSLASNAFGTNYQWVICPSYAWIPGATNAIYTPISNGSYAVIITENGCIDTSSCFTIVDLGVLENDFGSYFKVYPNPTDGELRIDLGATFEKVTTIIIDAKGKVVSRNTFKNSSNFELNIHGAEGPYFLLIKTSNGQKAEVKIIKKN